MKIYPTNSVACGNPAKVTGSIEDYLQKNRQSIGNNPTYEARNGLFEELLCMK